MDGDGNGRESFLETNCVDETERMSDGCLQTKMQIIKFTDDRFPDGRALEFPEYWFQLKASGLYTGLC